jgi:hypothetical protein
MLTNNMGTETPLPPLKDLASSGKSSFLDLAISIVKPLLKESFKTANFDSFLVCFQSRFLPLRIVTSLDCSGLTIQSSF